MEKISTLLKKTIKRSGYEKKILEAQIFIHYSQIVGEKIAMVSKPSFFKNGMLFIGVENSTWSNQLYFLKNDIISKINLKLSKQLVKDIKFYICKIEKPIIIKDKSNVKRIKTYQLPEDKIQEIEEISSYIEDSDLRQKFKQLMMKDLEYKLVREEDSCSFI